MPREVVWMFVWPFFFLVCKEDNIMPTGSEVAVCAALATTAVSTIMLKNTRKNRSHAPGTGVCASAMATSMVGGGGDGGATTPTTTSTNTLFGGLFEPPTDDNFQKQFAGVPRMRPQGQNDPNVRAALDNLRTTTFDSSGARHTGTHIPRLQSCGSTTASPRASPDMAFNRPDYA